MALWNKKRTHQVPTTLVHSAGTVTATFPDATYACSVAAGLTAFSMHYLYLRKISGVITLVFSIQIPSVFRASFADALLIGAFTANGTPAFANFVQVEVPPVVRLQLYQSTIGTLINVNVNGYVSLDNRTDPWGLTRDGVGAYNSATGNFATTQPRITNPIPNALVRVNGEIGWSPPTNVANTWNAFVYINGVLSTTLAVNGHGTNTTNLQWLRAPTAVLGGVNAGDYIELKALNDSGAIGTYMKHANVEFIGQVALKDL